MADWRIAGTYIEFCNCDPGCGCNFRGFPTLPEGLRFCPGRRLTEIIIASGYPRGQIVASDA